MGLASNYPEVVTVSMLCYGGVYAFARPWGSSESSNVGLAGLN